MLELTTRYSPLSFEFLPIEHLLNSSSLKRVTKLFLEVDLGEDGGSCSLIAHHRL